MNIQFRVVRFEPVSEWRRQLSYDPETDSLYIHLVERPSTDSDEVADGVVLDFDNAASKMTP